ncbi:MAG: 50S ribosomal protein L23 [Deltaproteobacteria bacterium]|nr:50S ribosomal protein L23 [Deltaproteobacteria bacterium]
MRPFYEVVIRPLITEKAVMAKEVANIYSFEVARDATKPLIRKAIEDFYKVKVNDVRTLVVRGKKRRIGRYSGQRPNFKKAFVVLAAGQKIVPLELK